jgi:hypothetical protein
MPLRASNWSPKRCAGKLSVGSYRPAPRLPSQSISMSRLRAFCADGSTQLRPRPGPWGCSALLAALPPYPITGRDHRHRDRRQPADRHRHGDQEPAGPYLREMARVDGKPKTPPIKIARQQVSCICTARWPTVSCLAQGRNPDISRLGAGSIVMRAALGCCTR